MLPTSDLSGHGKNKHDKDKINSFCEYIVFLNNWMKSIKDPYSLQFVSQYTAN